jgi:hypothetical protein
MSGSSPLTTTIDLIASRPCVPSDPMHGIDLMALRSRMSEVEV